MTNLEKAIIEEIDMILEDYDYENITEDVKYKIAEDIINNEDALWEMLNCIIIEKIDNIFEEETEE